MKKITEWIIKVVWFEFFQFCHSEKPGKTKSESFQGVSLFLFPKRLLKVCGIGLVVSLCLFYLMSYLISGHQKLEHSEDMDSVIEFIRLKREDFVQERKRQLPKKPKKTEKPPPPKKISMAVKRQSPKMKINPSLNIKTALKGGGVAVTSGGFGAGSSVTPIVRIEPQYPRKAALQRITGWVRLSFDITSQGTVSNVKVIASDPRKIFDMAAKRALYKWKYKPKMDENGKPVPQTGEKVQIDFNLENQE